MTSESRQCRICLKPFLPSRFRPHQSVCSSADCQRRRQTDYHRDKCRDDPEYRLVCRDSNRKWRERNRDYQRHYRDGHPAYVEHNRRLQRRRDRRRRMRYLVKNNLAFDLKGASADVWLAGSGLRGLVKNNLAISEVMIFQTVSASGMPPDASCKEHPAVAPGTGDL
jgi:hypothetical protein